MKEFEQFLERLSIEEKELFVKSEYGYIYTKAKLFLKLGPKKYLAKDFFEIDILNLVDEDFGILKNGCEQILMGRGLSPEKPFENLGVFGFAKMFEIFHFNVKRINTLKPDPMKFLDIMQIEHVVDGYKAEYYNLIEY